MNIEQELESARAAARRKDGYPARAILRRVIEQEPGNLDAWLLFAEVAQKPEHTVHCLERILCMDPENEAARQKLSELYTPRYLRSRAKTAPLTSSPPADQPRQAEPDPTLPEGKESPGSSFSPFELPKDWLAPPAEAANGNGAAKNGAANDGCENHASHPAVLAPFRSAYEDPGVGDELDPPDRGPNQKFASNKSAAGKHPAGGVFSENGFRNGASLLAPAPETGQAVQGSRKRGTARLTIAQVELIIMIITGLSFLCLVAGLVFLILGGGPLLDFS